jgi:hypothetical protein
MPKVSTRTRLLCQMSRLAKNIMVADALMSSSEESDSGASTDTTMDSESESSDDESSGDSCERSEQSSEDSESEDESSMLNELLLERLAHLSSLRYIVSRDAVPKSGDLSLAFRFNEMDPVRFRQMLRVTPQAFEYILLMIESHPVFQSRSNRGQVPVRQQLSIALYRFGRYGNGASVPDLSKISGLAEGTIVNVRFPCKSFQPACWR